jgi:hypothetical protein
MTVIINGTTGVTFPNGVTMSDGTSAPVTAAQGGTGLNAVGTAGNVLTSNGTTWVSQAAAAFDAGTAMMFVQTAAPTGWTKSTTHNDKALRVVSGTASSGGTTAFTTVFTNQTPTINTSGLSAGATTLNSTQIPSHTHTITLPNWNNDTLTAWGTSSTGIGTTSITSSSTGGGSSHTHTVSGSATSSAVTLNVAYVDVIIATKN